MSDLLSAASLFLAVLGLLYSSWYGEVRQALDLAIPPHKDDRRPVLSKVSAAYYTRTLPLVIGAASVSIILLPDLLRTLWSSFHSYRDLGFCAIRSYDAVKTLFCAIWAMTIMFTVHAFFLARNLKTKLSTLNGL